MIALVTLAYAIGLGLAVRGLMSRNGAFPRFAGLPGPLKWAWMAPVLAIFAVLGAAFALVFFLDVPRPWLVVAAVGFLVMYAGMHLGERFYAARYARWQSSQALAGPRA
jgi:hypothetical protein